MAITSSFGARFGKVEDQRPPLVVVSQPELASTSSVHESQGDSRN